MGGTPMRRLFRRVMMAIPRPCARLEESKQTQSTQLPRVIACQSTEVEATKPPLLKTRWGGPAPCRSSPAPGLRTAMCMPEIKIVGKKQGDVMILFRVSTCPHAHWPWPYWPEQRVRSTPGGGGHVGQTGRA